MCSALYLSCMTVVAHARKIKTAVGFANVIAHNVREGIYDRKMRLVADDFPDWISNRDRAKENILDQITPDEAHGRRNKVIKDAEIANEKAGLDWRKPQKNSAAAVEFVLSASPEFFKTASQKDVVKYFDDLKKWVERRYGAKNLVHFAVHYDEETPHAHAITIPIMQTEEGLKYSSGSFLGGRRGLTDMQTSVWKEVGEKYGLERGIEGSTARHTDQKEWIAEQRRQIQKEKEMVKAREDAVRKKEKEVAQREAILKTGEKTQEEMSRRIFDSTSKNNEKFDEIKRLLSKETPELRSVVGQIADNNKRIPAEKRDEYVKELARVGVSFLPPKEKKKSLDNENDKGR